MQPDERCALQITANVLGGILDNWDYQIMRELMRRKAASPRSYIAVRDAVAKHRAINALEAIRFAHGIKVRAYD